MTLRVHLSHHFFYIFFYTNSTVRATKKCIIIKTNCIRIMRSKPSTYNQCVLHLDASRVLCIYTFVFLLLWSEAMFTKHTHTHRDTHNTSIYPKTTLPIFMIILLRGHDSFSLLITLDTSSTYSYQTKKQAQSHKCIRSKCVVLKRNTTNPCVLYIEWDI